MNVTVFEAINITKKYRNTPVSYTHLDVYKRQFIISSILIWLRKSNMELMCREQQSMCFTRQRWVKNTKRDIVLISKIRTSEDITCSMKNCFAVIVQSGWKK